MPLGIMKKILGDEGNGRRLAAGEYIDLSDWVENERSTEAAASALVKVAEIHQYEDLQEFASHVYDGHLLILDFSPLANDEFALKRITGDLRKLAKDVGGDIAGYRDNTIIVCPTGVKVDRKKIRGSY